MIQGFKLVHHTDEIQELQVRRRKFTHTEKRDFLPTFSSSYSSDFLIYSQRIKIYARYAIRFERLINTK